MKKQILLMVALCISMAASAQIVVSQSHSVIKMQRPYTLNFYVKAGVGVEGLMGDVDDIWAYLYPGNFHGTPQINTHRAFNLSLGIDRTIGQKGAYWAAEIGVGSRGAAMGVKEATYNEKPVTEVSTDRDACRGTFFYGMPKIGWKFPVSNNIKIDTHLGGFFGYTAPIDEIQTFTFIDPQTGNTKIVEDGYPNGHGWGIYDELFDAGAQIGVGVWIHQFNIDLSYRQGFTCMTHNDGLSYNVILSLGYAIPLKKRP